jgi:WD40 repeat protein
MRRASTWGLMLLYGCKASISDAPPDGHLPGDGMMQGSDAPSDGVSPLGPWGSPQKIPGMSTTTLQEDDLTLSSDLLEIVFAIQQPTNGKDLYYASRTSVADPWTTPTPVSFNTTTASEETPRFSADNATLYFASSRASGNGTLDIFQVSHTPGTNSWGATPTQVPGVNSTVTEKWFMPCGTQGRYMLVRANGVNGTDFYEGTLGGSAPTIVNELNSPQSEISTFLSQDCLTIYFASSRSTPEQIFTSHRNDTASPWVAPTPVTDFMIPGGNGDQEDPYLAADNRSFFFASNAAGTKDLYVSTRQ